MPFSKTAIGILALVCGGLLLVPDGVAQEVRPGHREVVTLTLDEAIQIAHVHNNVLQTLRLDKQNGDALILEGWAELMPQISLASSYTRNVRSANPFSGSSAGGFFQSLGFIDWLAFNEQARTDSDAGTEPISVSQYFLRQQAGLEAAGVSTSGGDNPFAVPTQYVNSLTVTQKLFDGRAILGAAGASKWLGPLNEKGVERQEQLLVSQVKTSFYGALLASEQARVVSQSVTRSRATLFEVARQVTEGITPKFQRLSAEVELANLETDLTQTENLAAAAVDDLKLLLGIPIAENVQLRGALEAPAPGAMLVARDVAVREALTRRPDLEQALIAIELERIQLKVTRSEYLPTLDAFLNLGYIGNVPDSRVQVSSDPSDPFSFTSRDQGYFSDSFWDTTVSVGFRLNWTLFNGFASHRRIQQRKIAVDKARVNHEFLTQSVAVEVDRSLRNLRSARQRMSTQEQNVQRAELNYSFAESRLREGVATPIEVREASSQLDQSRLNFLQAVHDVLVAEFTLEAATGTPAVSRNPTLTSN